MHFLNWYILLLIIAFWFILLSLSNGVLMAYIVLPMLSSAYYTVIYIYIHIIFILPYLCYIFQLQHMGLIKYRFNTYRKNIVLPINLSCCYIRHLQFYWVMGVSLIFSSFWKHLGSFSLRSVALISKWFNKDFQTSLLIGCQNNHHQFLSINMGFSVSKYILLARSSEHGFWLAVRYAASQSEAIFGYSCHLAWILTWFFFFSKRGIW